MYEDTNKDRAIDFACWVGIDINIALILTSRIPKKVVRISAAGKKHIIDGDTMIYSSLNKICNLKGTFSNLSQIKNKIKAEYDSLINPQYSFERYAIKEYLELDIPREIIIEELSEEEILALYNWIS